MTDEDLAIYQANFFGTGGCPKCGSYGLIAAHHCQIFEILQPDYDGDDWVDAHKIHSATHITAAEAFARRAIERDNSGEPYSMTLFVRALGEEAHKVMLVTYEIEITYTAQEIK